MNRIIRPASWRELAGISASLLAITVVQIARTGVGAGAVGLLLLGSGGLAASVADAVLARRRRERQRGGEAG